MLGHRAESGYLGSIPTSATDSVCGLGHVVSSVPLFTCPSHQADDPEFSLGGRELFLESLCPWMKDVGGVVIVDPLGLP